MITCKPLKTQSEAWCMPEIIFAFRVMKVKRTPKIREKINTWIVKFSFKNMSQLKSAAF